MENRVDFEEDGAHRCVRPSVLAFGREERDFISFLSFLFLHVRNETVLAEVPARGEGGGGNARALQYETIQAALTWWTAPSCLRVLHHLREDV